MAGGNGKIAARFGNGASFFISFRNPRRKDFTRSCGKRTPKGCAVPLVVYKGLMRREAPKLGAGVGRQARKRAGFGAGVRPALLQVVRRGYSRSVGLQVSAGAGPMQGR